MSETCHVVSASPVVLALAEADFARSEISLRIRGLFDIVYSWLRSAEVRQVGHNYAIYDRATAHRLRVRVGFPVSALFTDSDLVKCVEFSAGQAAHATHVGPYSDLHVTYRLLTDWCLRKSLPLSGESWEVYGDWNDDASKLTTDLYLRLRGDALRSSGPSPAAQLKR
jgi:effector-binding domain-containing protein